MDANKVEVLTRKKGLLENTSPTGVKYIVEQVPAGQSLYRIRSVNKTGPEVLELSGMHTSPARAQTVLTRYLNEQWDFSDSVAAKNKGRKDAA